MRVEFPIGKLWVKLGGVYMQPVWDRQSVPSFNEETCAHAEPPVHVGEDDTAMACCG